MALHAHPSSSTRLRPRSARVASPPTTPRSPCKAPSSAANSPGEARPLCACGSELVQSPRSESKALDAPATFSLVLPTLDLGLSAVPGIRTEGAPDILIHSRGLSHAASHHALLSSRFVGSSLNGASACLPQT